MFHMVSHYDVLIKFSEAWQNEPASGYSCTTRGREVCNWGRPAAAMPGAAGGSGALAGAAPVMTPAPPGTTPAAKDTPFTTAHAAATALVPGLVEAFIAGFNLTRCAAAVAVTVLPGANV